MKIKICKFVNCNGIVYVYIAGRVNNMSSFILVHTYIGTKYKLLARGRMSAHYKLSLGDTEASAYATGGRMGRSKNAFDYSGTSIVK